MNWSEEIFTIICGCMLEGDFVFLLFVQVGAFPWSLFYIFLHVDVVVFFVVVCSAWSLLLLLSSRWES